jgi:hypothetical protein
VNDTGTGKGSGGNAEHTTAQPPAVGGVDDDSTPKHGRQGTTLAHGVGSVLGFSWSKVSVDVIAYSKEESEKDGSVVALGNVLGALFADHESKNEDTRTDCDGRNETEDNWDDTGKTEDEVDETVHNGVTSLSSDSLVHRMTNINNGSERTSKDGSDESTEAINDHGLHDGVRISCLLGGNQTHHVSETCSNTEGENNSNVITNFTESLDKGIANPCATSDRLGDYRVGTVCPSSDATKDNNWQGFRKVDTLSNVESSKTIVLGKDQEDGDQTDRWGLEVGGNLVEGQPCESDTCQRDEHGSNWEDTHEEMSKETKENVDESGKKVGSDANLPR